MATWRPPRREAGEVTPSRRGCACFPVTSHLVELGGDVAADPPQDEDADHREDRGHEGGEEPERGPRQVDDDAGDLPVPVAPDEDRDDREGGEHPQHQPDDDRQHDDGHAFGLERAPDPARRHAERE